MAETDPMTIDERRKYLHKLWGKYRIANKTEKTALLNNAVEVTRMHRKSVIRILTGRLSRKKRETERGKHYGAEVANCVLIVAESLDYICAERLQPVLLSSAEHLAHHGELVLNDHLRQKLANISPSTIKRILVNSDKPKSKIAFRKAPRKRNTSLKSTIPIRIIPHETCEPGHFELDTVKHCGTNPAGSYLNTLQMLDVATGWSEIVAICGSSFQAMQNGFDFIFKRLPFQPIELHPDKGSEFINGFVYKQWKQLYPEIEITRSKPYRKNDNRFVEENNNSLIRAYIGHSRLDSLPQLACLRSLYEKLYLYHNLFLPVMKLVDKVVTDKGLKRKYDLAKTPLDRLLETDTIDNQKKEELLALRRSINPRQLRKEIDRLIDTLLKLPCIGPDKKLNYYATIINVNEPLVTLSNDLTINVR